MFLGRKNKNGKGFSLTELLVVLFIIALISSLATVSFFQIRKKNRDNKRVNDIYEIQLALESYKFFEGQYPEELIPGGTLIGSTTGNVYLDKVPNNQPYYSYDCLADEYSYSYNEELENYSIYFCLEGKVENYLAGNKCVVSGSILDSDCLDLFIDGRVGHWALDNIDGVNDKTTNEDDGTAIGDMTIGGAVDHRGRNNGATTFDGVNDVVQMSDTVGLRPQVDEITFNWWMNVPTSVTGYIWSKTTSNLSTSAQYRAVLVGSTNIMRFQVGGLSDSLTTEYSATSLISTGWKMCTLVLPATSSGMKFYIDAALQEPTAGTGLIGTYTNNFPLTIGARNDSSDINLFSLFFNGLISDVRVYDKVLSPEEITSLFNGY